MHDAARVRVRQRAKHLQQHAQKAHERPLPAKARSREHVAHAPALDDAHRVVGLAIRRRAEVVNRHDVWVLELRGDAGFFDEARDDLGLCAHRLQRLQRNDASDLAVERSDHLANAALAERLAHRVPRAC
jgi:hypothetical protein